MTLTCLYSIENDQRQNKRMTIDRLKNSVLYKFEEYGYNASRQKSRNETGRIRHHISVDGKWPKTENIGAMAKLQRTETQKLQKFLLEAKQSFANFTKDRSKGIDRFRKL